MAACTKCGAPLNEGAAFCGSCGTPVAAAPAATGASGGGAAAPAGSASTGGMSPNVAGLLSYILWPITSILFLVLEPYNKDKFVRFHAFQSLFFGIACFVTAIVVTILTFIIGLVPVVGWIIDILLHLVLWLGILALWIFLMYKAYNNEKFQLPVIGKIAEEQAGK
jgi:uncharacterized membrane protein